jgi:hypothetical protein
LLAEWRFPEACVTVAGFNPPSADLPTEHAALAAHIHAARHMAAAFGAGQGEDAFFYTLNQELLAAHGLNAEILEATLPTVFERATRLLHDRLNTGQVDF